MREEFHAKVKITTIQLITLLSSLPQFHIYAEGKEKKTPQVLVSDE